MSFINIMGINLTRKMWKAFRGFDDATIDRLAEKPYSKMAYLSLMQDEADNTIFVTPKNAEIFDVYGVKVTNREIHGWLYVIDDLSKYTYGSAVSRFRYNRAEFLDTQRILHKESIYTLRIGIFKNYRRYLVRCRKEGVKQLPNLAIYDELFKFIEKNRYLTNIFEEMTALQKSQAEPVTTAGYAKLLDERKFLVNKIGGLENTVARYEKTISELRAEIGKMPEELELARSEASRHTENVMTNRYRPFLTFFNLFWANHANELKQLQIEQPDVTDIAKLLEYIERLKSAKLLDYIERTKS